jgi:hydrogenase maturation factor
MGKNPDLKRQGVSFPAGKLPAAELARMLARHTRQDGRVVVMPGIGKDATVISFAGQYLVAKTDPITFATDQIGSYVVHVNANDVAAMGGIPRWFLATLLLPEGKTGPEEVEAIFAQISGACQEVGAVLCGGHTEITYGLERPIIVGQMLGEVEKEKLIVPDRVRPGDEILMTKGIAVEGTAILARERGELGERLGEDWVKRCRNFLRVPGISIVREARIANGVAEVHAMHDPTEGGLATGLHELACAARVGMLVEKEKILILPETALLCRELKLDPLGLIASGALLIVAPEGDSARILAALEAEGIPVSVIGKIWEKEKGVKLMQEGRAEDLPSFERDELARFLSGGGS